jgi:hypothetical protein
MKKLVAIFIFSIVGFLQADDNQKTLVASQLFDAMTVFKNNLFKHENFGSLLGSLTEEVRQDFNAMVDDVWSFFCKVHSYCLDHLKNNLLIEKYKQFMQVDSLKGTVSFGLEDKEKLKRLSRSNSVEAELATLQSFYETLSEQERAEFDVLLQRLCQFFDELEKEYEQMLKSYSHVEDAFAEALQSSNKTLCIECGLEAPFPSFVHYIE